MIKRALLLLLLLTAFAHAEPNEQFDLLFIEQVGTEYGYVKPTEGARLKFDLDDLKDMTMLGFDQNNEYVPLPDKPTVTVKRNKDGVFLQAQARAEKNDHVVILDLKMVGDQCLGWIVVESHDNVAGVLTLKGTITESSDLKKPRAK